MKLFTKTSLAALSIVFAFVCYSGSAAARDRIHIDIDGVSIGFHGDYGHKYRYRKGYSNKHHGYHRKQNYYHDDYRYNSKKRYYKKKYYNNYYYDGNRNSYNDNRRYRRDVCPAPGYSSEYQRGRSGYRHKDHYHYE